MKNVSVFSGLYDTVKWSYEKIGKPGRVLAGVSGGADSVALLLLLCELRSETGCALEAVHIHHGLRSASDGEEAFVTALCERLNVPLRVCHVHVESGNVESKARQARYDAFFEVCEEDGFPVIALAHHAADRAETFLMRSVRGCGEGLGSLKEKSVREHGVLLWRPLLNALPGQLREANREKEQCWCEDESNSDTKYVRNFLRNEVFPLLEGKIPGSVKGMARSAEIIGDEQEYMRIEAEKFLTLYARETPVPSFDAAAFSRMHPALQRHIVRRFFEPVCGEMPFDTVEKVRGMRDKGKVNLPADHFAVRVGGRIYAVSPTRPEQVGGHLIRTPFAGNTGDGKFSQACPVQVLRNAQLRFRQNGDWICPLGMKGKKSLGDYMTDLKIPLPERDYIPLLCDGREILWVIGSGVSERMRITENDECVMLNYCRDEQ